MTNSYKTVLVHVNDERRADRLIAYAAEFAEAQGAHLIGLYVVPLPVVLNEWPDVAVAEMMETQRKAYREEGKRIAQKFRDKTKLMSKPAEWRQVESPYASVDQGVVQNARSADIVLAAQPDKSWHLTGTLDAAETAIMESGRPVLVIPNSGALSPSPKRVMIAWNGRKESTRAAFDALPVLASASAVDIVWIDPQVGSDWVGDLPCAELAATLARHGVKAEARPVKASEDSITTTLVEEMKRTNADMLVMGAYGHTRLREFILGGATRSQLRGMTLPVLFAH